jgi:hypothetical protein
VGRGAPRTTTLSFLPPEVAKDRGAVLHRALRQLPVPLLKPLLNGLRVHADALVTGQLYAADGSRACAVGAMLGELAARSPEARRVRRRLLRRRRPGVTIHDEWPELARAYPQVAHIEFIFDHTCDALLDSRPDLSCVDAARVVGLWMAAETQAEINLRHLETALDEQLAAPGAGQATDPALFAATVARLRDLRPWLSETQAKRAVEEWTGARQVGRDRLFVPQEWVEEVEQQDRRMPHGEPGETQPA